MSVPKVLHRTQFGNPILRAGVRQLKPAEILTTKIQNLVSDMRYTLAHEKLGVGLAAPQVGEKLAIAIIKVQPTESRPNVAPFEAVLINPAIVKTVGRKKEQWEGCISSGSHGKADLFAKVPRYAGVVVRYLDEHGAQHDERLTGLPAQIAQHEVDHLNGILFVDRVRNTQTYMTYDEYLSRVKRITAIQ